MTADPLEIRLQIPAAAGMEIVASQTAAALAEYGGADESMAGDIRMAVIEACVNAIEHAYGGAPDCSPRPVDLKFRLLSGDSSRNVPARIEIEIRDTGRGFDLGTYEEPTLEKKLHASRKRGWGLKLIRGFMDDLVVKSGHDGTLIAMTKYLAVERG